MSQNSIYDLSVPSFLYFDVQKEGMDLKTKVKLWTITLGDTGNFRNKAGGLLNDMENNKQY